MVASILLTVFLLGLTVSGHADDAYPLSATVIPWNDQINAQQYIDADAALPQPKGCRLEASKDYAFEVHWKESPATGWMPPITLRSGNRLYGLSNRVSTINIAPDAGDVVVSHVSGNLNFLAGTEDQEIHNCSFIGMHYTTVTGAGARVRDCLFVDFYNGRLWFDMATSGFLRSNRFIRTQSQGGTAAFYAKGNTTEPSGGNVLLGWSALTMNDQPAGTDVGRYHIENHTDATLINGSAENYSGREWPTVRVLGTPDLKMFGAYSFTQGLAFVDTDATRVWLDSAQISNQDTDTTYRNLILRPGVKSLVDIESVTSRVSTDQEPSPSLRATLFDYSSNTVVINGVTQPTTPIPAAEAAEFQATVANRTGTPWARPDLAAPPAAATGPANGTLTATEIQNLLDTQGTVILPPGVYDIDRSLKLGWVWTDLTTPGLHSSLRGHTRTLVGAGKNQTFLRATSPTIDLIIQGGTPYSDTPPSNSAYNGGTEQLRLTDLTLQGGRWGVSLTTVNGTNGVPLFQQYIDNLFNSICIRDMAAGGILLDGIYAWDNCCTFFVDFVNCPFGLQQIGHSGGDSTPDITYMDKCLFYGCQWLNCDAGVKMSSGRASNGNYIVDCVFRDSTSFAIDSQVDSFVAANCDFIDNAGAPVLLNKGIPTSIISCNFSAVTRDASAFIDGLALNVEGSTFTRAADKQVVMVRETTGFNDPLNWQDSVHPGNRGPYLKRHIHYANSTIGVPLGQWYNGTAVECDFQDPADAALRSRLVWTEAPSGNFDPWPVPAASISRHVLIAGTATPRPQLLVNSSESSPATVTYVGKANDAVGGATSTAQANFRSTNVPKAYDIDGNDVYGTDGYKFWTTSIGTQTQLPDYITSITPTGTGGTSASEWFTSAGDFGFMDDPTQSPGANVTDISAGVLYRVYDNSVAPYVQDLASIVLASTGTFRIGIVQITGEKQKGQQLILGGTSVDTLPEASGGTPAGTGTAVNQDDRFDIYLFDVTGTAGETITLQGLNANNGAVGYGNMGICGFTFDSNAVVSDPELDVTRGAATVTDGGSDAVAGTLAGTATTLNYTLTNSGTTALNVTTPVTIGESPANCAVTVTTQPAVEIATSATSELVISVIPTGVGPWSFTVSMENTDSNENPYNWTVSGTATTASTLTATFVGKENDSTGGDTSTAKANFRSTNVPKAFDIDDNNVYGTDGYKFWATTKNTLTQLPSYISSITPAEGIYQWYTASGFGSIDDPSLTPGVAVPNISAGLLFQIYNNSIAPYVQDLAHIVLASTGTFRIGIVQISGDRQKGQKLIVGGTAVETLPPNAGGTPGGTGTAVNNYDRFDIYLFDVTGTAGQTLVVQGMNAWNGLVGVGQFAICGFTFDSITSEASAYDNWTQTHITAIDPLANTTQGGNPDNDGANNLAEFAFNGNPLSGTNRGATSALIQDSSAPAGSELTLIVAVRDGATFTAGAAGVQTATVDGITYTIEGSIDLAFPDATVMHIAGPSDTAPAASSLPDLSGTEWEYHTFKLDASEGLTGKGFLRARVTHP